MCLINTLKVKTSINVHALDVLKEIFRFEAELQIWHKNCSFPKWIFKNHASDKHPQSGNINVDSIDVFIDIFEISSSVTNLTWETVLFGKNSFNFQRSLSTNIKLVHTLKKSLCGFSSNNFWKFIHKYNILSLLCLVETALTLKDIYQHQ